jgi:putative transposase
VLDLFSRRVVGWSMSAQMTAEFVTEALLMAIWRRGRPRELLHHSDQGSQYASEPFQRLLADHGITCSMSRSGFYNPRRRHSKLRYLSPAAFEAATGSA